MTEQPGHATPRQYPPFQPPQQPGELGRLRGYRVLELLGEGGMGQVFRAESLVLRHQVALKVIHPRLAADPVARERFLREMTALSMVRHHHVIPIYHAEDDGGLLFYTMELLHGATLEQVLLHSGGFVADVASVLRIAAQLAEALAAIHARGLTHRDLKPGNVWLRTDRPEDGLDAARTRGAVMLLDFGLASIEGNSGLTREGDRPGSWRYMAPEQAVGEPADHRADLYALGLLLLEMLCGERARAPGLPPALPEVLSAIAPPSLRGLLGALLHVEAKGRPGAASEVCHALQRISQQMLADPPAATASEVDLALTVRRRRHGWPAEVVASTAGVVPARTRGMTLAPSAASRPVLRTSDEISIEVSASRAGYVTVFNLSQEGELAILYPAGPIDEKAPPPPLPANQVVGVVDATLTPPAGTELLFAVWDALPRNLGEARLRELASRGDLPGHGATRSLARIGGPGGGRPADLIVVALELTHRD